jgi:anti-sigma regulatory factor (Ser/Thr protein kinase)
MEIGTRRLQVADESCVGEARRVAVAMATGMGMSVVEAGRAAIVATELARNLLKHAGGGAILIGAFEDDTGAGVECVALDSGPGIADMAVALRDGYSTAGSSGTGLGAVRRLSHDFDHYSRPGLGSAFLSRVRPGEPRAATETKGLSWGGVSLAKDGEDASGDAWRVKSQGGDLSIFVVDGLGHGPMAARAAHAAIGAYDAGRGRADAETMMRLHQALRPTRGATASILHLSGGSNEVSFIGVGNVLGVVASDLETRRMVNFNGTLGHALKAVRPFGYPTRGETLAVLASDGLGTHWSLDSYPGLSRRHPTLIAAVLLRDFDRGRDDVTVVVAKRLAAE